MSYEDFEAVVFAEAERHALEDDDDPYSTFLDGAEWGAGWAFAIIGMAQAIRLGRFCEICGCDMGKCVSDGPWLCVHCGRG